MGDKTSIEWSDATWNPVTGCTKVSEGCRHCYAERMFPRVYGRDEVDSATWKHQGYAAKYQEIGRRRRKFTDIRLHPDRLDQPLRWRKPRRIFVNSMSDLFHEDVDSRFLLDVFTVMAKSQNHVFQVLTKRPDRMQRTVSLMNGFPGIGQGNWPLPNVWLGVSVEDQKTADERIPLLLQTPAAVRFLSCEPLIGPVDLHAIPWKHGGMAAKHWTGVLADKEEPDDFVYWSQKEAIQWCICGGESGPNARPMHPEWAYSLRDQCDAAGVPFLFKQWGEWVPESHPAITSRCKEWTIIGGPNGNLTLGRVGKRAAGRELDGQIWDQFPEQEGG